MFSASMLGRGGPFDSQPGFGPVLTALSGHTHFTGWPDRAPTSPYGAYTDFLIPHIALSAIVAALDHRRVTGQGQHLDLSQLEASLYFVGTPMVDYAANNRVGTRDGNHDAYPCAGDDTWCTIACQDDAQWRALCSLMGLPALAEDARFVTLEARKSNEEALDAMVASWMAGLAPDQVMERCQLDGVAAGVVRSPEHLFDDPQLSAPGAVRVSRSRRDGALCVGRQLLRALRHRTTLWSAPLLGEHTEQVCRQMLGMSEAESSAARRWRA